jgi:hypothetical protein
MTVERHVVQTKNKILYESYIHKTEFQRFLIIYLGNEMDYDLDTKTENYTIPHHA